MRAVIIVLTLGIVATATGAARAAAADTGWVPPDESYALMVFDLGALAGEQDVIPEPFKPLVLDWPEACANATTSGTPSTGPLCAAT